MTIDLIYTRRDGTKAQVEVDEVIAEIKIPAKIDVILILKKITEMIEETSIRFLNRPSGGLW